MCNHFEKEIRFYKANFSPANKVVGWWSCLAGRLFVRHSIVRVSSHIRTTNRSEGWPHTWWIHSWWDSPGMRNFFHALNPADSWPMIDRAVSMDLPTNRGSDSAQILEREFVIGLARPDYLLVMLCWIHYISGLLICQVVYVHWEKKYWSD